MILYQIICCVNNAFFIMLQYIWDILYGKVKSAEEEDPSAETLSVVVGEP